MKRSVFNTGFIAIIILFLVALCSNVIMGCYTRPLSGAVSTIELAPEHKASLNVEEINKIVEKFILDHPEVVIKSLEIMQEKTKNEENAKMEQTVIKQRKILQDISYLPQTGNPEGNVTMIIFYDYNCSYSRKLNEVINNLMNKNTDIKFFYEPIAILGELSDYATRVALAVYRNSPENFLIVHNKLMNLSNITSEAIDSVLLDIGMDVALIKTVANSSETNEIINILNNVISELRIDGVPVVIIGNKIYYGLMTAGQLQQAVDKARVTQVSLGK